MQIFDGKAHAILLEKQINEYIDRYPRLTDIESSKLGIVQIGGNPASKTYIGIKKKFCEKLGLAVEVLNLAESLKDVEIISKIKVFFSRGDIKGGIIQLPLPRSSLEPVLGLIPVKKDVDLLSPASKHLFYAGEFDRLPPTVRAFDYFLQHTELDQEQLSIGVVGYGELVGKPIAHYATTLGMSVEVIGWYENSKYLDYQLLVLSAGVPNLVNPENISPESSVIDFGFSRVGDRTVGDLDMSKNMDHLRFISPSVGGMGPLVTRFLVMNFLGI